MINPKALLLQTCVLLFNCATHAQSSIADVIKKHTWLTSSITSAEAIDLNHKGSKSTDLKKQSPDCTWDDIILFKDSNVFIRDENKNRCGSIQTIKGSWNLIDKDSLSIKYNPESQALKYRIVIANEKILILSTNMPFIPRGVKVTYIFISIAN